MEKQLFHTVTTSPDFQLLRDKLADWTIVEGYSSNKSKSVIARPSLNEETINYTPEGYWKKETIILYFFDECNSDKIHELFSTANFKVINYNYNWETVSRELEIKDGAVLPYSKYTIEYKFLKSLSCSTC